jgi:hypothetical protein
MKSIDIVLPMGDVERRTAFFLRYDAKFEVANRFCIIELLHGLEQVI